MRQAVILAGGKGTRLGSDLPKPMTRVGGKPVLEHQLDLAVKYGFTDALLVTHYKSEVIEEYFRNRTDIRIRIFCEKEPMGTAGALLSCVGLLQDRFLLMYGDTMLNVDLERFWNAALALPEPAPVTLFVHPNDHPFDSDLVELGEDGIVRGVYPSPHPPGSYLPNLVNAALYVIEKSALEGWAPMKSDLAKNLFPNMLREGTRIFGYQSREYIKDMGTPDRLAKVERDFGEGRICSLDTPVPAVFLDRDGTLNIQRDYVRSPEELQIIEGVPQAVHALNNSQYKAVIVTNQPVIARGECDLQTLRKIHDKLETHLGVNHSYVDRIYFCPHHPDSGFEGERKDLKIKCNCRKPSPGLYIMAQREMNLDLNQSWMIGDSTADILAAKNIGVRSIVLRTGEAGCDGKYAVRPDYEFYTLGDAVHFILHGYQELLKSTQNVDAKAGDWIAIGGLARSGKSAFASALRDQLRTQGLSSVLVSLDSWIKPLSDRKDPGDTFDFAKIEEFIQNLSEHTGCFRVPIYNRKTRMPFALAETVEIKEHDIVIFEGVVGLRVPSLIKRAHHKIFVACSETDRKQRILQEYAWRGRSPKEALATYQERETHENPLVRATREIATLAVEL